MERRRDEFQKQAQQEIPDSDPGMHTASAQECGGTGIPDLPAPPGKGSDRKESPAAESRESGIGKGKRESGRYPLYREGRSGGAQYGGEERNPFVHGEKIMVL